MLVFRNLGDDGYLVVDLLSESEPDPIQQLNNSTTKQFNS